MKLEHMTSGRKEFYFHREEIDRPCEIPDNVTGLEFIGYDGSGVTRDPKGVLRLLETATRENLGFSEPYKIVLISYFFGKRFFQPREYRVGRTRLDAEVVTLAEEIRAKKFSSYIQNDIFGEQRRRLERFNLLRDVQNQVDNSLEDPTVSRESRGRLVHNPVIDGVEYTVDLNWVQTQMGKGFPYYFLKGMEYITTRVGDEQKILTNRYFKDPRVLVGMKFTGDHRKPESHSMEFSFDEKRSLMKLFRDLVPEIQEVTFPDNTRVRTD